MRLILVLGCSIFNIFLRSLWQSLFSSTQFILILITYAFICIMQSSNMDTKQNDGDCECVLFCLSMFCLYKSVLDWFYYHFVSYRRNTIPHGFLVSVGNENRISRPFLSKAHHLHAQIYIGPLFWNGYELNYRNVSF